MKISKNDTVKIITLQNVRGWRRADVREDCVGKEFTVLKKQTPRYGEEIVYVRLPTTRSEDDYSTYMIPVRDVIRTNTKIYDIKKELKENDKETNQANSEIQTKEENENGTTSESNTGSE